MGGAASDSGFRYTEAERHALAEAVPDPDWPRELEGWDKLVTFNHYEDFRSDKAGFIARELEWLARECLEEEESALRPRDEIEHVRQTIRFAQELRHRLRTKSSTYRTNFALAFLGRSYLTDDNEDYVPSLRRDEVFLKLLDELIENETSVAEAISASHSADVFAGTHHPAFARFVDAAIIYWYVWTLTSAGATKKEEGGPAARFLCAAVNPVITFARKEKGLTLRRGGLLTPGAAGRLIEENRRFDPSENE